MRTVLLYLSSNQNIGIFDFLIQEKGLVIKKLSGEFHLKKFVIHDMKNLSHYSYVAIDLKAIKDTEDEIIEAVKAFKTIYDSRLILFAEGIDQENELLSKLVEERIYNIITATSIEKIKEEILKSVSLEGMTYEDCLIFMGKSDFQSDINRSQYLFKHKDIKIAVAGVSSKSGTTTTAFNLSNFLHSIGAKVSYTEANNNSHLNEIAAFYEFEQSSENFYKYRNLEYYPDKQFPNGYNFNVFDLGILSPSTIPILKKCEVRIICAASKPYEITNINKVVESVSDTNLNTILSFTPEVGRIKLKNLLEKPDNKIYFAEYSPDLFDGKANEKIFKEILQEYVIEI